MNKKLPALLTGIILFICIQSIIAQDIIDLQNYQADLWILGDNPNDHTGRNLTGGDMNGDGFTDIVFSAPDADPKNMNQAGIVYIVFGTSTLNSPLNLNTTAANVAIYGAAPEYYTGAIAMGDVNGDGYDDIIIGSNPADPDGRNNAGEAYVVYGSKNPAAVIDLSQQEENFRIMGANMNDRLGMSVASGDINHDGYDDLILGAYMASPNGRYRAGTTHVIYGHSNLPLLWDLAATPADITLLGDNDRDMSGMTVACGDINADLFDDIIVGAEYADPNGRAESGMTYVVFGKPSIPSIIDFSNGEENMRILGKGLNDYSGSAFAIGDVNKDGYGDLILGAYYAVPNGRNTAGEAYIIFGKKSFPSVIDLANNEEDICIQGAKPGDQLGTALASGDINSDGYDDIMLPAWGADPEGRTGAGEVYVIFGGENINPSIDLLNDPADIKILGKNNEDGLGHIGLFVGDVNHDTYDDMMISALNADPEGRTAAGEVYILFQIRENESPDANAGVDAFVNEGETVFLNGLGSSDPDGHIVSYQWDLGDGNSAGGASIEHIYVDNGVYTATLTVTDDGGLTDADQVTITVTNVAPTAQINKIIQPNPFFILPYDTLYFQGSYLDPGTADTHELEWHFGNGDAISATLSPVYAWLKPGTYQVTFNVTDNNGGLGASSVEIVVKDELTSIDPIDAYIQNLPDDAFSKKANLKRKFFSYKFKLVSRFIERGRLHFATLILRYTVRAKMDGTVDGKSKNDWIIDPVAQQDLCNMIDALIGYLEKLLNPPLTKQPSMGTEIMMESPTEFVLSQNYPNPFNPRTTIHFQIPEAAYVKLKIYNAAGQEIRSLLDGAYKAGYHSITWDSKNNLGQFVSSGLYIYKMKAGEFVDVKKMQILK